ncbi:MAG: Rpn family recombination-promoting nuclease/putative transposase [Polyangiaceae bacterium]|nr:Rpn family recombination-promoting nuclease/putative transposase [Polyangiaceae bacterium]
MNPQHKQIHDACVRTAFELPKIVMEFLSVCLPADALQMFELASLQPRPEYLADAKLDRFETDRLYEAMAVEYRGTVHIFIEHQSTSDPTMPQRVLLVSSLIWERVKREQPNTKRFPMVVAVVLAHARSRWNVPNNAHAITQGIEKSSPSLREKLPQSSYFLFDVAAMTDEQIIALNASASLRLLFLVLRNVRKKKLPKLLPTWRPLFACLRDEESGLHMLRLLLVYILQVTPNMPKLLIDTVWEMARLAPEPLPKSLAWKWRQEGRDEGRDEGRQEGLEEGTRRTLMKLIVKRFQPIPKWVHDKIKRARLDELDRWFDRVDMAQDLKQVFN